ncbi:MAG: isochorismatase family protein [Candidatus Latescibacteria bacterium]|nr:isochorismatase family protein [Candidatus Latescibacterota bacterium]
MARTIQVNPRYYRWHVDPGVEWIEPNTGYATLDWKIPMSQAALVLVDVWDRHYLIDTDARAGEIIDRKIVPLLAACREAGLKIIHAPSPPQAKAHPNYVSFEQKGDDSASSRDDWPPSEFRSKSEDYAQYARPKEARDPERETLRGDLKIHPDAMPADTEAVIATGEELHQYCKQKGILFLFFLGFNTNACILARDYGTIEMAKRGYEIIMLRDCTTGMESFETYEELWQTRGAILILEMFGKYSLTSDELIAGLPK